MALARAARAGNAVRNIAGDGSATAELGDDYQSDLHSCFDLLSITEYSVQSRGRREAKCYSLSRVCGHTEKPAIS